MQRSFTVLALAPLRHTMLNRATMIIACPACQPVVAGLAIDLVIARAAADHIRPAAAGQPADGEGECRRRPQV